MELFLVCTETSGDLLGASLVHELKASHPDLRVHGVGGPQLEAEGMHPTFHVSDFNVMGLVEVLSQLKRLKSMFAHLVEEVLERKPQVVVLVDAPDFNLRFAKALKQRGLSAPIVYYVSPQVWAWRKGRAAQIARTVDHMMVLFSFEVEIYEKHGLPTTWVGHPLVDALAQGGDRASYLRQRGLDPERKLVALAPGSRKSEVTRLLPVMAEVVRARQDRYQFALALAPTIAEAEVRALLGDLQLPILAGEMRRLMRFADAAIVASGTATLETGLLRTPMIVGYRMKTLSYWLARLLVKVPHIALVNIVLGERVVPELIQNDFTAERIVAELDEIVTDGPRRQAMLAAFDRLEIALGGGGAAARAAAVIDRFLDHKRGGARS